jgi:NADH-quinone oxidoreductase subunit N
MLAYSSISHAGYALIGVVSAVQAKGPGVAGVLFYLFAYMFTTMGTFSMIILLTRQGFRGDHIADFAGLGRTHPLPALMFIIFFLSLAGIPPTAGFVGKLLIFRAAIEAGFVWLAVIGVATSAIAAYYYFMVIKTMYMDEPTGAVELSSARPLTIGLAIMLVATLFLGLFPNLVLQATEAARIVQ